MKIEQTTIGLRVIIPETDYSSKFVYEFRNVRIMNNNDPREQPLLNELEEREKLLVRKFILRAWSMWNVLKHVPKEDESKENNIRHYFEKWESHNCQEFIKYYHWALDDLIEDITQISIEYCRRSQHGWRF